MGYAELIQQRVQSLPADKQAEVYDFVEFMVQRLSTTPDQSDETRKQGIMAALAAARKVWPPLAPSEIDQVSANLRSQWEGRGWDRPC